MQKGGDEKNFHLYRDINLKMIIDLKVNHKTAREKNVQEGIFVTLDLRYNSKIIIHKRKRKRGLLNPGTGLTLTARPITNMA